MSRPHYAGTEIALHISIADEIDVADIKIQPELQAAIREIEDHDKKQLMIFEIVSKIWSTGFKSNIQNNTQERAFLSHNSNLQIRSDTTNKNRFHLLQNKCKSYSDIYLCT